MHLKYLVFFLFLYTSLSYGRTTENLGFRLDNNHFIDLQCVKDGSTDNFILSAKLNTIKSKSTKNKQAVKKNNLVLSEIPLCPNEKNDYLTAYSDVKTIDLSKDNIALSVKYSVGGEAVSYEYYIVGLVKNELKLLSKVTFNSVERFAPLEDQYLIVDLDKNGLKEVDYLQTFIVWSDAKETESHTQQDDLERVYQEYDTSESKFVTRPATTFYLKIKSSESIKTLRKLKDDLAQKKSCEIEESLVLSDKYLTLKKSKENLYHLVFASRSKDNLLVLMKKMNLNCGFKTNLKNKDIILAK